MSPRNCEIKSDLWQSLLVFALGLRLGMEAARTGFSGCQRSVECDHSSSHCMSRLPGSDLTDKPALAIVRAAMSPPTISHRDKVVAFLRKTVQATGQADAIVPSNQIFLLGGNPLPIRAAAEALSPKVLILVATPQTGELVHILHPQLTRVIPGLTLRTVQLPNHHDRGKLEEGLDLLLKDLKLQQQPIGLHYTGGTKTMAVNARLWWEARQAPHPKPQFHCSYLDGESDALIFDGCTDTFPLGHVQVPLDEIIELHQMRPVKKDQAAVSSELLADLACVASSQEKRAQLFELLPKDEVIGKCGECQKDQVRPRKEQFLTWSVSSELHTLVPSLPAGASWERVKHEVLKDRFKGERLIDDLSVKFLKETWTEEWIAKECRDARIEDVTVGRVYNPPDSKGVQFEIDVIGRVGHRPVVISVTAGGRGDAKNKVLELQHRAEQLGGSLAFAVFAWFHEHSEREENVQQLWEECSFGWSSPATFRVLGLAHLRGGKAFTHRRKEKDTLVTQRQTIQQMLTSFRTAVGS